MELKLVSGDKILDLPKKIKPTVDYELFSVNAENLVSTINGLDLPATDKNISHLNPLTQGRNLECEIDSGVGKSFLGTLSVDSQTFNRVDTKFECTIYDKIKKIFKDMDIDLSDIGNGGDTFDWDFAEGTDLPNTEVSGKWFLTGADYQGYTLDDSSQDGIPLNPTKFITKHQGLMWTISFYEFLKKVFAYYSIGFGNTDTDEIVNSIAIKDLYLFFPAQDFVVTPASLTSRDVTMLCSGSGTTITMASTATDGLEQGSLVSGKFTGTADSEYEIDIDGGINSVGEHTYDEQDPPPPEQPVELDHQTDSDVRIIIEVTRNETVLKTIDAGSIYNSTSGINKTTILPIAHTHEGDPVKIYATDEITLNIKYRFINYRFYNWQYPSDEVVTLEGTYTAQELSEMSYTWATNAPYINLALTSFDMELRCVGAIKPVIRTNQNLITQFVDRVDVDASLETLNIKVKDVIKAITERFNTGFYINSSDNILITNYQNRYDTANQVNLYEVKGEPFIVNFVNDGISEFEYKNDFGKVVSYKKEVYDGTDFNLGDVVLYTTEGGDKKLSLNMKSCNAVPRLYGEDELQNLDDLLDIKDSVRYWGVGNNVQLEPNDLPKIMMGFLGGFSSYDIRCPRVEYFNRVKIGEESFTYLTYVFNGNPSKTPEIPIKFYYPTYQTALATQTVLLGDATTGELDKTSDVYQNFESMLDNAEGTVIEVEGLLSKTQLDNILDGYVLNLDDLYNGNSRWAVLSMEGFLFDQTRSVVKFKLKKI